MGLKLSKRFDRTVALIGEARLNKLANSHVAVVGLGGVGGAAVEMLARSGVGKLTVVDGDVFEPSNLNRQLLCTVGAIGKNKAVVAKARIAEIAPETEVACIPSFATADNIAELISAADYIIDAIDDIKNKILLITAAKNAGVPIISAMGAGNRLDCDFAVTDVYATENDPFAKVIRRELKKTGINSLDVVCAKSKPFTTTPTAPASIAFPPNVMGAMLASFAVKKLIGLC